MATHRSKYEDFLQFLLEHKLVRTARRMTDEELVDLYESYSPEYFRESSMMFMKVKGTITVYMILEELHRRYPNKITLGKVEYPEKLPLRNLILKGVSNVKK